MKMKQIYMLVGALVLLLLIYFWSAKTSMPIAKLENLVDLDTAKVTEISIFREGGTLTMKKEEKGWHISNPYDYAANNGFVKTLLDKLTDTRIETEVTGDKTKWVEFEVADTTGTRLTLTADGKTYDVIIGKSAPGYKQTYARKVGEDTVYLIRGTYGVAINRKADQWREKKFTDFEESSVIQIDTPKFSMTKKQGETSWTLTPVKGEPFTADDTKANRIASSLAKMRTSDFPEEKDYEKVDWTKPLNEVTVQLISGEKNSFRFFKDPGDENRFFVRYNDNPVVFRVYKGIMSQVVKEPKELVAEKKELEAVTE